MKSMTGYGRGESENDELRLTVEIKTVNNRYCEIISKQPRQYMALEDKIKKYISAHIERGRVEVFINTKEKAEKNGADYLGVGAAFATGTKKEAKPIDFAVMREICESVQIPVVAIGGITAENVAQLKGTGIDGVAVVSAIFASDDKTRATRELLQRVKEIV